MAIQTPIVSSDASRFASWTCAWTDAAEELFAEPPEGWTIGKHWPTATGIIVLPEALNRCNFTQKLCVRGIKLQSLEHMSIYDAERMKLVSFFTKGADESVEVDAASQDAPAIESGEPEPDKEAIFLEAHKLALSGGSKPEAVLALIQLATLTAAEGGEYMWQWASPMLKSMG